MQEDKINEIAADVKKFLARESNTTIKINDIEDILRPDMEIISNLEEKTAFNNFIRKGIESQPVTKAFLAVVQMMEEC